MGTAMPPLPEPPRVRPERRPWHVMGVTMYVRVTGSETDGAYSVMEHVFPPGAGPAFLLNSLQPRF